jgi:hypothetical protein
MSFHFKLEIVRVECLNEQLRESGKDEMRMLGYGVSRRGHFFQTGFRKLGSYGTADVRPPGASLPQTLFERDLEDDGLEVLLIVWLVEQDGGGVRDAAAELDQSFRQRFFQAAESITGNGFPRECIPFLAMFRVAPPFQTVIEDEGRSGRDDKVFLFIDALFRFEPPSGIAPPVVTKDHVFRRSKNLGDYLVTFRTTYRRNVVSTPD